MKPTIGIIGGCGPLATLDIEHKILKATQKLLHPLVDQDYFNLLVFNRTQFHDRSDAISSGHTSSLLNEYLDCAKSIESVGVDVLLIACQTAHVYLQELQNNIKVPIIDIVQEVSHYTSNISAHIQKVGLLSTEITQKEKLYQKTLTPYGVDVITVPSHIQKKLMEAIYIIKAGINLLDNIELINEHYHVNKTTRQTELENHPYKSVLLKTTLPNPVIIIKEAITYLANQGCKHVILGCTELPLVLPHINLEELDVVLIDPNTIVAESAVYIADKLEKEKLKKNI
jgi:aspartate racemase